MKNRIAISVLLKFTLMGFVLALFSATSAQAQTAPPSATLVKEFLSDVGQGETVKIKYTLTNNTTDFFQAVGFSDDLDAALTGMTSLGEATNTCGGTVSGTSTMSFSRTFMEGMTSCELTILAQIPANAIPGTYPGATSMVAGNIFLGAAFSDPGDSADLVVSPLLLFTKSFIDDPVNSGDPVILEFILTNQSELSTLTDIGFTDDLDAALSGLVATSLPLSGLCGIGVATGTSTLSFTGGRLLPLQSCSFQVPLLMPSGSVPGGSYTSTTSAIDWTIGMVVGSSPPASDELRVGLPTLTKSFTDDPVFPGEDVTLEFTITNNNPTIMFTQISFTDDLDAALSGLDVKTLPDAGFCGASSAITGTTVLTIAGGELAPMTSCTFNVILNVPNDAPAGNHLNTTSDLTAMSPMTTQVSDSASDELNVIGIPVLTKTFIDDPAQPGGQVTLEFSITNFNRLDGSTNISFTDDLDAALSGLTATGLPLSDPCGAGSTLSLTDVLPLTDLLTLTGGSVAPGGTCTFSVTLDIPASTVPGSYLNTTSALTSDVGGIMVIGATASDFLDIEPVTLIALDWSSDPVAAGTTATMDITLTNSSIADAASDISFTMNFDSILPTMSSAPTSTCDGDVVFAELFNPLPPGELILAKIEYGLVMPGTLAPGASCTIQVVMDVAPDASTNVYMHTSSGVTSTVNMVTYTGPPGSDDLLVVGGPILSMVFSDDPTIPGATANLELTLTHEELATTDATAIGFTIDLDAIDIDLSADLTNLAATGLPMNDICGMGSSINGTGLVTFSGGTLAAGASCTFNIPIFVPLDAVPNNYDVESTAVTANVSGIAVSGSLSSDVLIIAGFIITKEFLTNPVIPGEMVTLRYDFTNLSLTETASVFLAFQDVLDDALPGLTAIGLPADDICGTPSSVTGAGTLTFDGMVIAPSSSCSLDVVLQVPLGAADGTYTSASASQFVFLGPNFVTGAPAITSLEVLAERLQITKQFINDPVAAGDSVTLNFVLTNLDTTLDATSITFTDDLDVVFPGLMDGLIFDSVLSNDCVAMTTVTGVTTSFISAAVPSLAANQSCTISTSLTVSGAASGGIYSNTTSQIDGTMDGLGVFGSAAIDELNVVDLLDFSIAFDGPTTAPGSTMMTVTITNPGAFIADGISFSDDLNNVIPGLMAISLPAEPCGVGSSLSGTSFLTFTGGELAPMGGMCSFDIVVLVPASAMAGNFPNTTSNLSRAGLIVADPASADLVIEPAPAFSKVFMPDIIGIGFTSTLTFTIDNTSSVLAANGLDFTDNLPSGVLVATPSNAGTTCTGGTLTAVSGASVITYSGGSVGASSSCTLSVDVTSSTAGSHVNVTGDLTSSSGNSGTASDTLIVDAVPVITVPMDINMEATGPTTSINIGMATVSDDRDVGLMATPDIPGPLFAVGVHEITWSVTDSAGNMASEIQTVTITDNTAPDITITGPSVVDLIVGDTYIDAGATASDLVDEDLTADIMTTNPVDTNMAGTYLVNYSVTDSNGNNNNVDRTVNVRAIIGGTVAGLTGGESVIITDGSQQLTLSNGVYSFVTEYELTNMYLVSIVTQPGGPLMQTCMLSNQSGSITSGSINNIDINCAIDSFGINVQVTGLDPANTIELSTNGQSLSIASNGPTNFAMPIEDGQNYAVLLDAQPTQPSQECTITGGSNNDGSGLVSGSDVLILVDCVTNSYLIGGMVTGLELGNEISLSLNTGLETLVINTNSAFVFNNALVDLSAYNVTVTDDTSNPSQTCQVNNGSGNLDGQDIVNVEVVCSIDQFFVGGQLTGLIDGETVTVQNNGTDNLILDSNGGFVFTTPIDDLSPYDVSVLKQTGSNGGRCTIKSNTGMIAGEDVLGVFVNCDGIDELIFKNGFENP